MPVYGRDYSVVQSGGHPIDWEAEAKAGVRFAYLRCGVGNDGVDPDFCKNACGAKAAGIAVGPYQFTYPIPTFNVLTRDPVNEAKTHYAAADGVGTHAGELPPACDLEWPPLEDWGRWGCSPSQIRNWAALYLAVTKSLWGRTPLVYTYPYFWRSVGGPQDSRFAAYPLWLADYGNLQPLGPWAGYTVWQTGGGTGSCHLLSKAQVPVDEDQIADEESYQRLLTVW